MTEGGAPGAREPAEDQALAEMHALLRREGVEGNPLYPELQRFVASYGKLLRRFNKTVSISDRYQLQLMDLKARLEITASTDLLTGLANRRKIMEQLQAEQSRAERHGEPFSILIADLDNFKGINDGYGHQAGDHLLKGIACCFRGELRAEDACGRWGGEEFLIMLPETGRPQACLVAEKLIARVGETAVYWDEQRLSVTMSVGVGSYRPGMTLDACIKLADDALYAAKNEGRNRFRAA